MTRPSFAVFIALLVVAPAPAADPLRFAWKPGQVQTYSVSHTTTVSETTRDEKDRKPVNTTIVTAITLLKRWEVKAVDAAGVATLEMVVTALKQEHTKSNGEKVTLDSATPDGAKAFAEYLRQADPDGEGGCAGPGCRGEVVRRRAGRRPAAGRAALPRRASRAGPGRERDLGSPFHHQARSAARHRRDPRRHANLHL